MNLFTMHGYAGYEMSCILPNLPLAQTEKDLKDLLPQNIDPDTIAVIGQD